MEPRHSRGNLAASTCQEHKQTLFSSHTHFVAMTPMSAQILHLCRSFAGGWKLITYSCFQPLKTVPSRRCSAPSLLFSKGLSKPWLPSARYVHRVAAQVFDAQEQGDTLWLAHADVMWLCCWCPAPEDPRQVAGVGMYMWCLGWLSWQSRGCSGGCWCRWDGWERWWELHFLALHPASLLALPPGLCKPSRR